MAAQKVRLAPDRDERQEAQRKRTNRTLTIGSLTMAAIVGAIVVLMAVVASGDDDRRASTAAISAPGSMTGSDTNASASPAHDRLEGLPREGAAPSRPLRPHQEGDGVSPLVRHVSVCRRTADLRP